MQDIWLSKKANEIQSYADKESKLIYDPIKAVYGSQLLSLSPLLSADYSTLIIEKAKILLRWAQHFDAVLNRPLSINSKAIQRLPQVPINKDMDIAPTLEETKKAVSELPSGKAPEIDVIPAEVYKLEGIVLVEKLVIFFQSV